VAASIVIVYLINDDGRQRIDRSKKRGIQCQKLAHSRIRVFWNVDPATVLSQCREPPGL
jgi:hypothetical protein